MAAPEPPPRDNGSLARWIGPRTGPLAVAAIVAVLFVFRSLLTATTDLAEDEAYYWLWSLHLAAGYYDHPPMVAYWIGGGTALFGGSEWGIRFFGLVSVLGGSVLMYYTSLSLFRDKAAAALCVLWLNATLLCNAASILATPDTPLAFFIGAGMFSLAKLNETGRGAWWYAAGLSLGLAALSKYTAVLVLPGLALWIAGTREGRGWLKTPHPYAAAILGLAILAPMIFWNYAHGWASFAKQIHHGLKDVPKSALQSAGELIGGQAGLATPLIFAFCIFGSGFAFWRGIRRRDARFFFLGAMTVPLFLFFLVHAASQKIQPNWPGFVYPAAILAAVHSARALSVERRWPQWTRLSFSAAPAMGIVFTLVAFFQLAFAALPIPAKKDPSSRLRGWADLANKANSVRRETGAGVVLTDRYAMTGELAYYMRAPLAVLQVNERIRYANLPPPDEDALKAKPALFIGRHGQDVSAIAGHFERSRLVTTLARDAGFDAQDTYDAVLLSGYRGGLFADLAAK